ncbi:hypothetical protein I4U23_002013 [Adineta vaga]|nr:hypothetical protein I4U23_002013 [Adineta vaga]
MEDNMIPVTFVDEPLLVVLDDDDDDGGYADDHNFDLISKKSNEIVSKSVEEQQIDLVEISPNEYLEKQSEISIKNATKKPKIFYHSSKSPRVLDQSNQLLSTTKNEKKKSQNQRRIKNRSKNKDVSSSTHQQDPYVMNHSTDSIFSFISFENTSNVLTVSRMGSIYYCIEDLYLKVFSTLCTLEEFIDLLLKPGIIHLIPMTLSEKISIEELCSKLKEFNRTRYRLVTINSTEYLIIEEMQTFKCSSIYINPNNKDSSHLLTNDEIHQQNNYGLDDLVETNKTISPKTVSEIILENISKYIMTDKQIQDMPQHKTPSCSKCTSTKVIISSKQHHIRSTPYPLIKTYFAPLNTTQSEMNKKESHRSRLHQPAPVHNSSTLISPPNTPNGLTLTKIPMSGINLSKAIARYGYSDIDKLPKLVVRYKKIYTFQTIDVMGQLFPTWFNEPDYRCVHCFTCDQVFTPQQFMTHIDDEKLANKQPIDITSIELLPSEKFSKHKVELWNQFCFNLAIHSKTGQIDGFIRYENL